MNGAAREISAPASGARLRTDSAPWYRQFWPWFLVSLPLSSVVFSLATVVVAVRGADSLVRDDWYDAGVSINRDFGREREAATRGLAATLEIAADGAATVVLSGRTANETASVELAMASPSDARRDQVVHLVAESPGRFVSSQKVRDPQGHWDVALSPPDAAWRIAARVTLAPGAAARALSR